MDKYRKVICCEDAVEFRIQYLSCTSFVDSKLWSCPECTVCSVAAGD